MAIKTSRFDLADYLETEEDIQEYFRQVMEDGDPQEIIDALGYIAKARGMMQLAKDSGLNRESLYKALRADAKPRFDTIWRVMCALNLKPTFTPQPPQHN